MNQTRLCDHWIFNLYAVKLYFDFSRRQLNFERKNEIPPMVEMAFLQARAPRYSFHWALLYGDLLIPLLAKKGIC